MKECCSCKQIKPVADFSLKRGKPNARCKVCKAETDRQYRLLNKEKESERHKRYWKETKGTEQQKKRNSVKCKTYRQAHPEVFRYHTSKRRALLLLATPSWCNEEKIYNIYRHCPAGYEVDHIVPLNSSVVCGLHVEHNLQYLPIQENRAKSNKHII